MIEVRPIKLEGNHWVLTEAGDFKRPIRVEAPVSGGRYQIAIEEARLKELEKETGLDLSVNYKPSELHPFYTSSEGTVKLENHTMFFDDTNPFDEIRIGILKASPKVANSIKEYEANIWPDAEYVIYNREDEISRDSLIVDKRREAYSLLGELDAAHKRAIILLISGEDVRKRKANYVEGVMGEIIEKDIDTYLKYAKLEIADVESEALVRLALNSSILRSVDGHIYYGDVDLGVGETDAVTFLSKASNSNMRIRIQEKVDQLG